MRVYGLDLSLACTGLVSITDADLGAPTFTACSVKSAGHNDDPWYIVYSRLVRLATLILEPLHTERPDLIVLEGPAFSRTGGHAHDRSGLWWKVYEAASEVAPVAVVKPNTRALYATGKGNAGKDEVLLAVSRRYPGAPIKNNNEADALALAAMGCRWLGHPIDSPLPKRHVEAMDAAEWPALVTR